MNEVLFLSNQAALVSEALEQLHASTGIHGKVLSTTDQNDVMAELEIGKHRLQFSCEIKQQVDRYALLADLANQVGDSKNRLLVSYSLSQDMANRCRELGLQFMDTAGNAHINDGKGIYVFVSGQRRQDKPIIAANSATITPAVLRMMFGFLADPSLLNAPYRDIAYCVQVSTGAIGKVFDTLEARGLIGMTAGGKRIIRSPETFLNEWASGYAGRLKPKLTKYRFATDKLDKFRNWNPRFRTSAWGWGGEMGAMELTNYLQAEECTIYIDLEEERDELQHMVKQFRLRADPRGPIEVVQIFWNSDCFTKWFPTVPPHLIYADLLATQDSRNIAVAKQIAAKVIEHVHDSNG